MERQEKGKPRSATTGPQLKRVDADLCPRQNAPPTAPHPPELRAFPFPFHPSAFSFHPSTLQRFDWFKPDSTGFLRLLNDSFHLRASMLRLQTNVSVSSKKIEPCFNYLVTSAYAM